MMSVCVFECERFCLQTHGAQRTSSVLPGTETVEPGHEIFKTAE